MKLDTYEKIETVLKMAGRPIAPHEFVGIPVGYDNGMIMGLEFIGCSESALGRRLREMREIGRVTSQTRDGKTYKEYALPVAVAA